MCNIGWTTCSEYDNQSEFNSQRDQGDLYDHLMSTRIFFTMTMNKNFVLTPKIMSKLLQL